MKKNWNNPELTNLSVSQTKEDGTPFFFDKDEAECSSPVNTGNKCNKPLTPCQYFTPICEGWTNWGDCKFIKIPPVIPSGS